MPKHEPLTPKAIANRIKAKGLQKLRWYCQMCQKQCRDQNGFKCHLTSESHQRQLLLFSECPGRYMNEFSTEFQKVFLDILRRQFGTKRVKANTVYQEYIKDRHHVHMNSTCWYTLTGFVNYLGRVGICKVDKTEKGWYIQYIDKEVEERRQKQAKKIKMDKDDEQRAQELIMRQAERAMELQRRNGDAQEPEPAPSELKRNDDEKIEFKLPNYVPALPKVQAPSKEVVNPLKRHTSREGSVACSVASSKLSRSSKTALAEIMEAEERRKELRNRRECWMHKGIAVKIVSDKYGAEYAGRKAVVLSVDDDYCTASISLLDTQERLDVHQRYLETVIPALGKTVMVVNGAYRGSKASLESIDVDGYCATIKIKEGPTRGRVLENIDYEDISKWCE
uniref:Kin17_mid domain-containing protein n=1 Tax=Trichuris muris TaxID=70415 RepID=A0A5S6R4H5_TRIMR